MCLALCHTTGRDLVPLYFPAKIPDIRSLFPNDNEPNKGLSLIMLQCDSNKYFLLFRKVAVINLDPANDTLPYPPTLKFDALLLYPTL